MTVVTKERTMLFGDISDGVMVLNPASDIVKGVWLWLAEQYPYVVLDEFCVMPNHFHGILMIDAVGAVHDHGGTVHDDGGAVHDHGGTVRDDGGTVHEPPLQPSGRVKPLGGLIGAFKTVSTKQINLLRNTPGAVVWQRNYYEHIVRNEEDMQRIAAYILHNPQKWETDRENSR